MAGRDPDAPNALATARGMPRTGTQAHRRGATPDCGASRQPGAGGQTRVGWVTSWPSTPRSRGPRAGGRGEAVRRGEEWRLGLPSGLRALALDAERLVSAAAPRSPQPSPPRPPRNSRGAERPANQQLRGESIGLESLGANGSAEDRAKAGMPGRGGKASWALGDS